MSFLSKTFKYVNNNNESIKFTYDEGYLINFPDGVDSVSVSLSTAVGPNNIGSSLQSKSINERAITINGKIIGKNGQELKDRLVSVIRPDIGGKLFADKQYLNCYVSTSPVIGPEVFGANFQIGLLAPYPFWTNKSNDNFNLDGIQPKFKFPWNISRTYKFGEKITAQYMTVPNIGQVAAPFKLIIKCLGESASNPKITDLVSGEFLLINKNLDYGEILTIITSHSHTVVESSKDGNCDGALDIESNLYRLHTGDNVIKPSADSGRDNLTFQILFSNEYIGVTVV